MQLSFVLVNYRVARQVLECLKSLEAIRDELECEFIVVDNSPPEAERLLAGTSLRKVRVISNGENQGYGSACNAGAREASAPYVWFLNPDVRFVQGSARQMLDWLESHPSISLAGPRILNSDGSRQYSCRSFPDWRVAFAHRSSFLTRVFPANPLTSSYLRSNLNGAVTAVDWASGCSLLVRKATFEAVGGFDEGYFLFFEDVDLAYRMKQMGAQCVSYPGITFTHGIGSSRAYLPDQGIRAKHLSAQRYFTKNVIRNRTLAGLCRAAISMRGFLSEQYHRSAPSPSVVPPPRKCFPELISE